MNIVKIDNKINRNMFYNYILPQLHKSILNIKKNNNNYIILDFDNLYYIEASQIPNILIIGLLLKKLHIKTDIVNCNEVLLNYLLESDFLSINNKNNLFNINNYQPNMILKKQIRKTKYKYCTTFYFVENTPYDIIYYDIKKLENKIIQLLLYDKNEMITKFNDQYYKVQWMLSVITEIVGNACEHSGSIAIASFQALDKTGTVIISISDHGYGYEKTISEKLNVKNKDKNVKQIIKFDKIDNSNAKINNIKWIFEAIYYRYKIDQSKSKDGLYQAIQYLLSNRLCKINIHNNNSSIELNNENGIKYLDYDFIYNLFSSNKIVYYLDDLKYKESKYNGVHIEIEVEIC